MVTTQDVAHRDRVDAMPQVRQGALNAAIAPGGILFGHAHDELLRLLRDTRASQLSAARAPVKLLGDQALVPAQEGVRRGKRGDVFEALAAKRVGEGCQRRRSVSVSRSRPPPRWALRTRFSSCR